MTEATCSILVPGTDPSQHASAERRRPRSSAWAPLAFACMLSLAAAPAPAAVTSLTVDTTAQRNSAGDLPGSCTLGDAIVAANHDTPEDGCWHPNLGTGGPFEIILPPGSGPYVLSASDNSGLDGENGLPLVTGQITMRANGNVIERDALFTCPDASNDHFRIFEVAPFAELYLGDAILRNGCAGSGGALRNAGVLVLTNGSVSGSTALTGNGGAVDNAAGTLDLVRSTLSGNQAFRMGGGVNSSGDALITLDQSTVSGNTSNWGCGIENMIGISILWNSTVSGNTAAVGGGIENSGAGSVTLVSSTIARNRATLEGAGIVNRNGSLSFSNSLLGDHCLFYRSPGNPDAGHNLSRRTTCGLSDPTSQAGVALFLSGLADNGGPTQTHALRAGSPAIDAGDAALCMGLGVNGLDQRDVSRADGSASVSGSCDVGAFEFMDCDGSGVDDGSEIAMDRSLDQNGNMLLDACENQPPVADAGSDRVAECSMDGMADVLLDGTGSSDPEGDALTFTWTGSFGSASGSLANVMLPVGAETVSLRVADAAGNEALDTVDVTVMDTSAPSAMAWLDPAQGSSFTVHASCGDVCDPDPLMTASVDGELVEDGALVDPGPGGTASLTVTCDDANGNMSTAAAQATADAPPEDPVVDKRKRWRKNLRWIAYKLRNKLDNWKHDRWHRGWWFEKAKKSEKSEKSEKHRKWRR